jgi:AraC-like DNA-binding protein
MTVRLTGSLHLFASRALYVGPAIESARHRHHAAQLLWAPGGIDLEVEQQGLRRAAFHVIAPRQLHRHGRASLAAVLWIDPDELRARSLRQGAAPRGQAAEQLKDRCSALRAAPQDSVLAHTIAERLFALATTPEAPTSPDLRATRHPAVSRMRRWLDGNASEERAAIGALARQSGLSVRQLRHRFTLEVGINPRAYRRWCRLRRAIEAIGGGASLTEGAFEGGFSDSAHFSRVFRAQFGMPPRAALSGLLSRAG